MSIVRECLELIQDLMIFLDENPAKRFEELSERFYRETGIMAPGKSVPLEISMSQPPDDVRANQYQKWIKQHLRDLYNSGADKLARYKCEKHTPSLEFQALDILRQFHDECCDGGHRKQLDVGPMVAPSEKVVLAARVVLEQDIAIRKLGVPPEILGDIGNSNRATIKVDR